MNSFLSDIYIFYVMFMDYCNIQVCGFYIYQIFISSIVVMLVSMLLFGRFPSEVGGWYKRARRNGSVDYSSGGSSSCYSGHCNNSVAEHYARKGAYILEKEGKSRGYF